MTYWARIAECLLSASVIGCISLGETKGDWFANDLFLDDSSIQIYRLTKSKMVERVLTQNLVVPLLLS